MVFFNYTTMEMSAKIVYYGPGLGGKTTNLQYIYEHLPKNRRGEIVSLPTETDRTLFFDLLPLRLGKVGRFTTRLQLYTVPGQVFYNSTRKLVLKGVDGVVFVADSQEPMLDANIESLENLQDNLAELKLSLKQIPWVIQFNKRDLSNIMPIDELNRELNFMNVPSFESSALTGEGVMDTLKGISKLTLQYLRQKAGMIEQQATASITPEIRSPIPEPGERETSPESVISPPKSTPIAPAITREIPSTPSSSKVLEKHLLQMLRIPIDVSELRGKSRIRLHVELNLELPLTDRRSRVKKNMISITESHSSEPKKPIPLAQD